MTATELLEVLVEAKTEAVAQHGGPVDLAPRLLVSYEDGRLAHFPVTDTMNLAPVMGLYGAMRISLKAPATLRVEWAGYAAESYGRVLAADSALPARGQFERDFTAGDMTVMEMLVTTVVSATTRQSAWVDFHYDDHGRVVFGEVSTYTGDDVAGVVADSLALAFGQVPHG